MKAPLPFPPGNIIRVPPGSLYLDLHIAEEASWEFVNKNWECHIGDTRWSPFCPMDNSVKQIQRSYQMLFTQPQEYQSETCTNFCTYFLAIKGYKLQNHTALCNIHEKIILSNWDPRYLNIKENSSQHECPPPQPF